MTNNLLGTHLTAGQIMSSSKTLPLKFSTPFILTFFPKYSTTSLNRDLFESGLIKLFEQLLGRLHYTVVRIIRHTTRRTLKIGQYSNTQQQYVLQIQRSLCNQQLIGQTNRAIRKAYRRERRFYSIPAEDSRTTP